MGLVGLSILSLVFSPSSLGGVCRVDGNVTGRTDWAVSDAVSRSTAGLEHDQVFEFGDEAAEFSGRTGSNVGRTF